MQVMPFEDAARYRFNPFDVTKVWPHADYPPMTVGRLVLHRNPENHFAEIEQAAFAPANMVPGIGASPDKMLLGRLFSYPDAHRYRIGTNYQQLPVNEPLADVNSYSKDGSMRFFHNGSQPVYAPNSYGGPKADASRPQPTWETAAAEIGRYAYELHAEDDDFGQARSLCRDVMSAIDRSNLVSNVAAHLDADVSPEVLVGALDYWRRIDSEIGDAIARKLGGKAASATVDAA
jgi:catalase